MNTNEFENIGRFSISEQLIYFGARFGGKVGTSVSELNILKGRSTIKNSNFRMSFDGVFLCGCNWKEVTKTLGDVKGVVSVEDRQLLKIVHKLSDEAVDEMISEYQKQYKLYLKNSKMYGKEKWR